MENKKKEKNIALRITDPILIGHWITSQSHSKNVLDICVVRDSSEGRVLQKSIQKWATILNLNYNTISFPDTQTKQRYFFQELALTNSAQLLCVTKNELSVNIQQQEQPLIFHVGDRKNPLSLANQLEQHGYIKEPFARTIGSFARHGDSLTIVQPHKRIRIDIHGNKIETIRDHGTIVLSIKIPSLTLSEEQTSLQELLQQRSFSTLYTTLETPFNLPDTPIVHFTVQTTASSPYASHEQQLLKKQYQRQQPQKTSKPQRPPAIDYSFLETLTPGDLIVHQDHGIGTFQGIETTTIDKISKEFFVIEYAHEDRLLVPLTYAGKLSKYIGAMNPTIHRIGGALWNQARRKVKKATEDIAKDLALLYAKRAQEHGFQYPENSEAMIEFESAFPYIETPDQHKAIQDIMRDMENDKPVDRLVCGDVGFGKTEVAMRAAFKATEAGKQVAVLSPTTILSQQHFDSFQQRFKGFPQKIAQLSRFIQPKEQKTTLEKLQNGTIDIIIGTHRLLSKDVQFKNLGLLIIDEEQRFGVQHKEHFKKLRTEIDILTLSATPIPRTLNMAVSGIRDISNISTPPPGRKAVKVNIEPQNTETIHQALEREYQRNGQAYYLFNSVQRIYAKKKELEDLCRQWNLDMTIGIGHGQLDEKELASVIEQFDNHKIDILLCTTIVQNGIDIPNVNTMIIEDAPHFGLTQLYQLKGRVGRSERQGYAYFFYNQQKLSAIAKQRLDALQETEHLGAGFEIAMRDMEIRGTGNILGAEQSGNISAVGMSLYAHMLEDAIMELEYQTKLPQKTDPKIDLPLTTVVPKSFVQNESEHLSIIERITHSTTIEALTQQHKELQQEYGKLPKEIENIFTTTEISLRAANARLLVVTSQTDTRLSPQTTDLILEFADQLDTQKIQTLLLVSKNWTLKPEEKVAKINLQELGTNWSTTLKSLLRQLEVRP